MKSVAIVLDEKSDLQKLNAKRFYADLNVQVYYFKSHSAYWIGFLRRNYISGMKIVAINQAVSARLTTQSIPHLIFDESQSVKNYLTGELC